MAPDSPGALEPVCSPGILAKRLNLQAPPEHSNAISTRTSNAKLPVLTCAWAALRSPAKSFSGLPFRSGA